jgi:glycosyltransferase involved in cell wall biosynthesis
VSEPVLAEGNCELATDKKGGQVRVLHILGSLDRGGAETRIIEALQALPSGIVESHFMLLSGREGDLAPAARALGAQLHPVRLSPTLVLRYWSLLRSIRPTVAHSHVYLSSGFFLMLASWRNVPVRIAHFRSFTDVRPGRPETHRRRVQRLVSRWMVRRYATDIVAVSRAVLDSVWPARVPGPQRSVLYNGVATDGLENSFEADSDEAPPTVVQVGRLDETKNQLLSVKIFSEVVRRGAVGDLWLVGRASNGYRTEIERRIDELGVRGRVKLCGVRSDVVTKILPKSTATLHPSTVEGLPGAILESLATGTPVVASDIPPNREVADQLDGIRLIGLDQPTTVWVEALLSLLKSPPTKPERLRSLEAFRRSEFALERHVPKLLELWGVEISEPH